MSDSRADTMPPSDDLASVEAAGRVDPHDPPGAPTGWLLRAAYIIGSAGILLATAADALGVAGRHAGLPLLGSIELVQASVVVLASTAMFVVTMHGGHAAVEILSSRLSPGVSRHLHTGAALLSAAAFLLITIGSIWVASEMWQGHEITEILQLPIRWLRLIWILFALLVTGAFIRSAWSGRA